tara:strand:- start:812 stop:1243 length:432 start_codon:yes stop_codon:yes gene_type:complete
MKKKKEYRSNKGIVYGKLMVGILLSLSLIIWAIVAGRDGGVLSAIVLVIIALTIAVFFIGYTIRELKSVKQGLPVEDERSKKVMNLAFAKAYLISIYLILFLSWASDDLIQFKDVSQGLNVSILGMAIIFGLCWLYYNRRPDI